MITLVNFGENICSLILVNLDNGGRIQHKNFGSIQDCIKYNDFSKEIYPGKFKIVFSKTYKEIHYNILKYIVEWEGTIREIFIPCVRYNDKVIYLDYLSSYFGKNILNRSFNNKKDAIKKTKYFIKNLTVNQNESRENSISNLSEEFSEKESYCTIS